MESPAGAVTELAGNVLPTLSLALDVLAGDADRDGRVTTLDVLRVREALSRTTSAPGTGPRAYSPFRDADGSGQITAADSDLVRARLFSRLPAVPAAALTGAPATFSTQLVSPPSLVTRLRDDAVLV